MTNSTKILAACGVVAGFAAIAALPGVGHAADPITSDTADTVIKATVNTAIDITATEQVQIEALNVNDLKTANGTFTVGTNNASGYNVKVKGTSTGAGGVTALTNTTDSTKSIAYQGSDLQKGASGWNLNIISGTGAQKGIPGDISGDGATVATTSSASVATGDVFNVTYGVATNGAQAGGNYEGKVTYTATVNP